MEVSRRSGLRSGSSSRALLGGEAMAESSVRDRQRRRRARMSEHQSEDCRRVNAETMRAARARQSGIQPRDQSGHAYQCTDNPVQLSYNSVPMVQNICILFNFLTQ